MFNTILLSINLLSAACADSTEQNKTVFQDSLKEDIVIKAVRADNFSPVTQYNFSKKEINEKYYGQDISYVLQSSPSIVAQSDAGNGFGYSYIRMRGLDNTRINFNINGVPVNDAETQGFFTNNFADLASSAQSIQVQRGVGTTGNGTAPYAGSIGLVTNDLRGPTGFGLTTGYGSFNSSRVTAEYNTGMIKNRFAFYGRLSSMQSDGYRNNSGTDLKTYFVSGAYFGKKSILKFNAFGGITRSQLSYYATDKSTLDSNRTYNVLNVNSDNPGGRNISNPFSKDEFQQSFYQLQYTYFLNSKWNIAASAYYVHGVAPLFQVRFPQDYNYVNMPYIISGTDTTKGSDMLNNYRLNQDFFGAMAFLNYETEKLKLNFGVHANTFKSVHFLEIPWTQITPEGINSDHGAYSNTGYKSEVSAFVKASYYFTDKLLAFGDLQLRNASFSNVARDNAIFKDTFKVDKMNWTFFNPKAGLRYFLNNSVSFYGSVGYVTREPTRTDLMQASDYAMEHITQNSVKPETVVDIELGSEIKTDNLRLGANVYLMEFRNEIAATGALNYFGYGYRKNVASSFRRGVELSLQWRFLPMFTLISNSTFSYNKIKTFTQTFSVDSVGIALAPETRTKSNVDPILTPNAIVNLGLRFEPLSWINLELMGRYVSKSYLDNTNNEQLTAPEYLVGDFRAIVKLTQWIKIKDLTLAFQCNNFTNTFYSPAGTPSNYLSKDSNGNYSNVVSPAYFPAATRNFFLTLSAKF